MKKIGVWMLAFVLVAFAAGAQRIRVNPYGTGVFDDKVEAYSSPTSNFKGKVEGGFQWGSGLEYRLHKNFGVEFLYLRQDTKMPLEYYDEDIESTQQTNFDLALNYLLVGGVVSINPNKTIEPYAGFLAGMTLMRVDEPGENQAKHQRDTRFAWGLRGGVNFWVTKLVAIRLQSQLIVASRAVGGDIYFGSSANTNASTYSSIAQFGLGAGLAFKVGR